ncbi:hypothetical protein F5Y18DRAFT_369254 [Xylariaceae sp. FL1019]|nr:hypothetical protein F5Y18DRAFT_369254 [Xylariaceae sp. FL1019]
MRYRDPKRRGINEKHTHHLERLWQIFISGRLSPRSRSQPKALNHGNLSWNNLILNESTFIITGILDWFVSLVRPFGPFPPVLHSLASQAADDSMFYGEHESFNEASGRSLEDLLESRSRLKGQSAGWPK